MRIRLGDLVGMPITLSFFLFTPAEGKTNLELRQQLLGSGTKESMEAFKAKRPGLSREGSDVARPSLSREGSSGSMRSAAAKPPSGTKPKKSTGSQLSVPGVRREKSGELRSPGGIVKSRSGTSLKSTKPPTGVRKAGSATNLKDPKTGLPRRTDSQTSIGSTGSQEGSEASSVKSPTSPAGSSRIPVRGKTGSPEPKTGPKTGLSKTGVKGSKESLATKSSASGVRGSRENLASKKTPSTGTKKTTTTTKKPTSGHTKPKK